MTRLFQVCAGLRDHPCTELTQDARCPSCAAEIERTRRPSAAQRYGPGYQRRHREAIAAEPWCHYPNGCTYRITPSNPLTAQHAQPMSLFGPSGPLEPWCLHHNSGQGNRPA